jgi:diadenosine tetraphosphate (Ap4A) HIT family hydrolase
LCEASTVTCRTCQALAGEISLTNAPRLDLDDYWRVEHIHPVAIAGWLVLVLRRHALALHELTDNEATALGHWLPALTRALHAATGCELEYVMQFAEAPHHHHVHFHLIARQPNWPEKFKGPAVWAAVGDGDPMPAAETTRVMEAVAAYLDIAPTTA